MNSYIELNTKERASTNIPFEKDLFKLLNNAIFGKSMENVKDRCDIRFVTDEKKYIKMVSRFNFKRGFKYNDNLYAVELDKTNVLLDNPIYVGATILDLSKLHMSRFHLEYT